MPPSYSYPSIIQLINIAGVDASPKSVTVDPTEANPEDIAVLSILPVSLGSRPIETLRDVVAKPDCFASHRANPTDMKKTAVGVKVMSSPSIPANHESQTLQSQCRPPKCSLHRDERLFKYRMTNSLRAHNWKGLPDAFSTLAS